MNKRRLIFAQLAISLSIIVICVIMEGYFIGLVLLDLPPTWIIALSVLLILVGLGGALLVISGKARMR